MNSLSFQKAVLGVEPEKSRGYVSNVGLWCNAILEVEFKVVRPNIYSWVKETNELRIIGRTTGADIAALVPVAKEARQCKIFCVSFAEMFLAEDVVYFASKFCVVLMNSTVFASVASSKSHCSSQVSRDVCDTHVAVCNRFLACALTSRIKCSICA